MNIGKLTNEEIADAVSTKAGIRLRHKLNNTIKDPRLQHNTKLVVSTLCKMSEEVFNGRPEFNLGMAIMVLALIEGYRETLQAADTEEVIYL